MLWFWIEGCLETLREENASKLNLAGDALIYFRCNSIESELVWFAVGNLAGTG